MNQGLPNGTKKTKMRAYCRRCRHEQTFVREVLHHGVHLIFTIATLGLWGLCWAAIYLGHYFRPWRCEHCHWHRPELRERKAPEEAPEDAGV